MFSSTCAPISEVDLESSTEKKLNLQLNNTFRKKRGTAPCGDQLLASTDHLPEDGLFL